MGGGPSLFFAGGVKTPPGGVRSSIPLMARYGIDLTACWRPRVGMVTVALEFARALAADGRHRLVAFCSRERPPGLDGASEAVLAPYRHEVRLKLSWLPAVEAEAGLDAVLYPYWPSPPRRRADAPPAAVFVHDLAFRLLPGEVPWQQRAYLGSLLPPALRQAAAVLVPSLATRRDLLDLYPLPGLAERTAVVPEGPTPLPPPPPGPPPAGLAPGFLLAVGTLEPRKNYGRLLQAYGRLSDPPPLVIAGRPGWNRYRLPEQAGVRLLGHVDDTTLAALYAHASALAYPSLYEGFGIPLLDALGWGLPALIGNQGALPELAAGAALEVEAEDVDSIAAGLERLLGDTGLREELVEKGKRRAAEFSWKAAGRSLAATLERIGLGDGTGG